MLGIWYLSFSFHLGRMKLHIGSLIAAVGALGFFQLANAQTFYGLNYGINENSCPTVDSLKSDFNVLKPYTNRVRTFTLSVCNQGDDAK